MAASKKRRYQARETGTSRGAIRRVLKNLRRGRLLWRFESFRDFREVMEPGLRWSDLPLAFWEVEPWTCWIALRQVTACHSGPPDPNPAIREIRVIRGQNIRGQEEENA